MNRTYFMNMALQGPGKLTVGVYEPMNFAIDQNFATRFPLLPIMKNEYEEGDRLRLIVLQAKNADAEHNTEMLRKEIEESGMPVELIVYRLEERKSSNEYADMILSLLKETPEEGTVSIDVTYGTKPEAFLIYYTALIAETSKRDVELDGIYYGQILRSQSEENSRCIHRLDMMKSMLDMTRSMRDLGYSDIEGIITGLFAKE